MPETFRQAFVDGMIVRLSDISIANGYNTDVVSVDEWRFQAFNARELPAVVLRDLKDTHETANKSTRQQINHLKMEIEGAIGPGQYLERNARKLMADIEKAIGLDREWGGLAIDTTLDTSHLAISETEMRIAGVVVEFTIHYASVVFDSYQ
jgi:hypothetical protein